MLWEPGMQAGSGDGLDSVAEERESQALQDPPATCLECTRGTQRPSCECCSNSLEKGAAEAARPRVSDEDTKGQPG